MEKCRKPDKEKVIFDATGEEEVIIDYNLMADILQGKE